MEIKWNIFIKDIISGRNLILDKQMLQQKPKQLDYEKLVDAIPKHYKRLIKDGGNFNASYYVFYDID